MELSLKDFFSNGLRTDSRQGYNKPTMLTMAGLSATPEGAIAFRTPETFTQTGADVYPFPFVFRTPATAWSISKNRVSTISGTTATDQEISDQTSDVQHLNETVIGNPTTFWTMGTDWATSANGAVKSAGSSSQSMSQSLGNMASAPLAGRVVRVKITINTINVGGWIQVSFGGGTSHKVDIVPGNNYVYVYTTNTTGQFQLTASAESDFVVYSVTADTMDEVVSDDDTSDFNMGVVHYDDWWVAGNIDFYFSYIQMNATDGMNVRAPILRSVNSNKVLPVGMCGDRGIFTFEIQDSQKDQIRVQDFAGLNQYEDAQSLGLLIGLDCSLVEGPFQAELSFLHYTSFNYRYAPFISDAINRNLAVVVPLPISDTTNVTSVCIDATSVLVLSNNGVFLVMWAEGGGGVISDVKVTRILSTAVDTRACVKYQGEVYFLTYDRELVKFGQNGVQRLGYKEFLSDLDNSADIYMVYNEQDNFFLITDGVISFAFNGSLSQVYDCYTSMASSDTAYVGVQHTIAGAGFTLLTNDIDIDPQGGFILNSIHPVFRGLSNLRCRVYYKTAYDDVYRVSPEINFFNEGFVIPYIRAKTVRIEFKGAIDDADSSGLYDAVLKFQNEGRQPHRREFY